ncbi:hypothetical protein Y032_0353g3299 [Ancylostoma ceylanicum]|uniref:Uncharacterized protein n=1 Tax=Ancylostoma ceylanicum TaxID=53326 RepID=A0A016RX75_9BILA|nr:hypothetical protein Y032_0353g3299 [Ancylostoma ceylanicum]
MNTCLLLQIFNQQFYTSSGQIHGKPMHTHAEPIRLRKSDANSIENPRKTHDFLGPCIGFAWVLHGFRMDLPLLV